MRRYGNILLLLVCTGFLGACSTTRLLEQGEYRLEKNIIEIDGPEADSFRDPDIESYLRQQPNSSLLLGWNPLLNVYNWSGRNPDKWINKLVRSLGEAPVVYDADLVQVSADNLKNHLEYLGWFGTEVDASPDPPKKKRVTVRYRIHLGRRYPISSIDYDLPTRGTFASDFLSDTANVTIRPGSYLSESALSAESERSAKEMRNHGYFGFSQAHYAFLADTLAVPGQAALTYQVMEHSRNEKDAAAEPLRRYSFRDVSISYPETMQFRDRYLKKVNGIFPGAPYNERVASNTYSRLSSIRFFNAVNLEMTPVDTAGVDCHIRLTPSNPNGIRFGIEASTNSTGLVGLSPQLSYYHKNIFHGGEWLNIGLMGNFQMKVGKRLQLDRSIRSTEFGASASISFPRIVGLPIARFRGRSIPRTDLAFSYNYQNRPEYTRNILSTSLSYAGNLYGRLFYQFSPAQLSIVRLYDVDVSFVQAMARNPFLYNTYQDHFDAGASMMLHYTTNSDANPTTSYHYARLSVDASGNVLSCFKKWMPKNDAGAGIIWETPFAQYLRLEGTLGRTWTFGREDKQAIATRLLGGIGFAYGNSVYMPFEKQFYGGGAGSLRGWQARTVGPGTSELTQGFVIPNQTGDIRLEANIEYRFPLFWRLRGALFCDAGNVWNRQSTASDDSEVLTLGNLGESLALSWGTGIRIDLSYILLRVDMGFRLHDPANAEAPWRTPNHWLDANGYAIHFGVGYPF